MTLAHVAAQQPMSKQRGLFILAITLGILGGTGLLIQGLMGLFSLGINDTAEEIAIGCVYFFGLLPLTAIGFVRPRLAGFALVASAVVVGFGFPLVSPHSTLSGIADRIKYFVLIPGPSLIVGLLFLAAAYTGPHDQRWVSPTTRVATRRLARWLGMFIGVVAGVLDLPRDLSIIRLAGPGKWPKTELAMTFNDFTFVPFTFLALYSARLAGWLIIGAAAAHTVVAQIGLGAHLSLQVVPQFLAMLVFGNPAQMIVAALLLYSSRAPTGDRPTSEGGEVAHTV